MVGRYRIITDGIVYKVQRKGWLFWRHCSSWTSNGEQNFKYPSEFDCLSAAQEDISRMVDYEQRHHTWKVIDAD